MAATNTYKSFLMIKRDATWEKLVDIKEYPNLGSAPDTLETTTLSDAMKTYVNDLQDTGALEFTANYEKSTYQALKDLEGTEHEFGVWFGATEEGSVVTPTGTEGKWTWKGMLAAWPKGAGTSAVREMGISIAPSTVIDFA